MASKKKRTPIPEEVRAKLLLWCARHCCFCGKACTTNIEIHHIDSNPSNNDEDNLVPLCFDCHGEIERYNPAHPSGIKYRYLEIKTRRDQIYEQYTRRYLRQVEILISNYHISGVNPLNKPQKREKFGDISCSVINHGEDIPLQARIRIMPYHMDKLLKLKLGDLYAGKTLWNLNPSFGVHGHFDLKINPKITPFYFRVEVFWSIIDQLKREHEMLPFSYVWTDPGGNWWYDPMVLHA